MAEYIEREAAKNLACEICQECDGAVDVCEFRDIKVDSIPAADVRPVVTCGECIYFRLNSCMRWADGTFMERSDFCSRAAKREKS